MVVSDESGWALSTTRAASHLMALLDRLDEFGLARGRRITVPLALPTLLAGALVAFLQALNLFGSPAILAIPAGFHTLTTRIWSLFQFPPKPELAAAASIPLLVLTILLLRAQAMALGRRGARPHVRGARRDRERRRRAGRHGRRVLG